MTKLSERSVGAKGNNGRSENSPEDDPLRFSVRGLLSAVPAITLAAGLTVSYPAVAALAMIATMITIGHFPQPFLRYFPRTTLLCFASVGIAYIAGGLYASVRTGSFDQSFVGRVTFGTLSLLITWGFYMMVKRREV